MQKNRILRMVLGVVMATICTLMLATGSAFALSRHSINLERDLSQNAYHADAPALSPTGAMTIESWVNLESLPALGQAQIIMSKWTTSCCTRSYHFYIVHSTEGISLLGAVSSTGLHLVGEYQTIRIPYLFSTSTWYHVAFVFTPGNKMELFVDGVSIGSVTTDVPSGIFDNTAEFQVGAGIDDTGPNNFFDGKLDDVRLWGVTRTASEIASNKDAELAGTEPGLLGYWKFNGDALDATANGNHLSLRNGPVFDPEEPVLTPSEQAIALVNAVLNYNFPKNIENSYLANLMKLEKFIEDGMVTPAINQLNAFIEKVENDYALELITQGVRDDLVGRATLLIGALEA